MQQAKQKVDFNVLWKVIAMAKPYNRLFVTCMVLAVLLAPISSFLPYIVKTIVDEYIVANDFNGLLLMCGLFFVVLLANVIMRYYFLFLLAELGQNVLRDLRVKVFKHITQLRLRYFDQTPIGTSTTRTINDISAINEVFTQGVITILADLLAVLTVLGIMFYTSWRLTLISLATLPLLVWATYIFSKKVKDSYERVRTNLAKMNAFLQERITGMRIVQIFNAQKQESGKFKTINRDYTSANLDSVLYYSIFFPVVELISAFSLALMVWIGAGSYLEGSVSFGALVAFPLYLDLLFRPVRMAADKFNTLQMGLVAAERVFKLIESDEVIPNEGSLKKEHLRGKVAFKNVHFAYDEENFILHDLNFTIEPGQTMALVGSTGSGKSTIINIMNRFYDIQKGQILLDDVDIRDYELSALRKRIAIVLQDVFLFDGTVYENITLKDNSIAMEKVIEAAKKIGADDYITRLPDGYQFMVTERGSNLSVGQRQLISFVRALVVDPDILILDEATSSIDTETEMVIQHAIEKLIEKRSSIIIAHRLSTIRHADFILVMDQGKAVESGSHEALLEKENGRYRELYEMQDAGIVSSSEI
ncbi:MAG: ABC transporter ATP-binding protein [Saprospiraceae bacterium]|nr:ABC transporter ATP-binding protein [Saprospiraceae bacterium]